MNGSEYEGEWIKDVQRRKGKETQIDGTKYDDHNQKGMQHGYGVYTWADESQLKGNWNQNKIIGYKIH